MPEEVGFVLRRGLLTITACGDGRGVVGKALGPWEIAAWCVAMGKGLAGPRLAATSAEGRSKTSVRVGSNGAGELTKQADVWAEACRDERHGVRDGTAGRCSLLRSVALSLAHWALPHGLSGRRESARWIEGCALTIESAAENAERHSSHGTRTVTAGRPVG